VFAIAVPPIPIGVSSVFCDIVAPAGLGTKHNWSSAPDHYYRPKARTGSTWISNLEIPNRPVIDAAG
jgi:hypothetical protein